MPTVELVNVSNFRMTVQGVVLGIQQGQTVTPTPAEWNSLTKKQKSYFDVLDGTDLGGDIIDRSGAIAVANASQQVMATNDGRKYLLVQNISDTDMWINFGVAATTDQPSVKLVANTGSIVMDA